MKAIVFIIQVILFYNIPALSSGGSPPPPPLFKAKNTGSVYLAPLITGANKSGFFSRISYTGISDLDGRIDLIGTSTDQNGIVDGKNFEWDTPPAKLNLGLRAKISETLSMVYNVDLNLDKAINLGGFDILFNGLLMNESEYKLSLALGLNIHPTDFKWYTAENNYRNNSKFDFDPVISITYNTDYSDWIINPLIQFTYTTQTLVDVEDESFSGEVYKNVTVLSCTPGASYKWTENKIINLGLTFSYVDGIANSGNLAIVPQLQLVYYF